MSAQVRGKFGPDARNTASDSTLETPCATPSPEEAAREAIFWYMNELDGLRADWKREADSETWGEFVMAKWRAWKEAKG